jgi:mannitol/fructose-specific phosphotransferase system IIA component (Ntr-type)
MMAEKGEGNQSRPAKLADPSRFPSLVDLLPPERIKLAVQVGSWQEAIREAGRLLLDSGAITSNYIDAMIKVAEELGPYIAIAPGIALPHAASESGARQTALSLVKLAKPVNFGNPDNDPVQLVFGLSAVDKQAHIVALQTLAELFLSKDLISQLFAAESISSVVQIFHEAQAILKK